MPRVPPVASARRSSTRTPEPSCATCFFATRDLCALAREEPCPTFRPDSPDGLRPPQQMRFSFGVERRARAPWAFPSAAQQAERYAAR